MVREDTGAPSEGNHKAFNIKDPNDLETMKNMFLCDSDEYEDMGLDESDIDEEKPLYSRARNAKDAHGAEIGVVLGLLYFAGLENRTRVNLEDLWRMD
ncbi:hypothetical protein NPIL_466601 [Nephila pilipes]|uniref:Uncharacterized protein n=1 Tax=Nephila pilipes TaxID=299642 RepID=A0A8X6PIR9_NEPPI|nr:hypothetical protein NPIL_466601 [Nephila pilipes]